MRTRDGAGGTGSGYETPPHRCDHRRASTNAISPCHLVTERESFVSRIEMSRTSRARLIVIWSLLRLINFEVNVVPPMNKDSLEMPDEDQNSYPWHGASSVEIETTDCHYARRRDHGTDGLYPQRALPDLGMPIILTGAMTPLGIARSNGIQYVLIDSRTGITDTSGICTSILPEKLIAVFTPNRQSLDGVLDLARVRCELSRTPFERSAPVPPRTGGSLRSVL